MSVFESDSRLAFTSGIVAIVALVFAGLALLAGTFLTPLSFLSFLFMVGALALFAAAARLGYQLYQMVHTSYALDRNAFVIRWGGTREIVPMGDVQRVIAGSELAGELRFARVPLPGWWVGEGSHPALGQIRFYATAPLDDQIIIVTPEQSYAVSPYDDEAFLEAFRMRLEMRPTQNITHARLLPAYTASDLWHDRVAQVLLILAVALNLGIFGLSAARYPAAPAQLALHFDATGAADRIGNKPQLFALPVIAFILLLISAVMGFVLYRRGEKLAAFMLWGGSAIIQALMLVATVTIGFTLPS
jgi:hypothetical protein